MFIFVSAVGTHLSHSVCTMKGNEVIKGQGLKILFALEGTLSLDTSVREEPIYLLWKNGFNRSTLRFRSKCTLS